MDTFRLLMVLMLIASSNFGSEAIIDGKKALGDQFPYMASLQHSRGGHECGAAIIHELFVLTAGHCVYKLKELYYVIEYDTVKLDDGTGQVVPVKKFHLHPHYVPETYAMADSSDSGEFGDVIDNPTQNDIAVVEVAWPFDDGILALFPPPKSSDTLSISHEIHYTVAKIGIADKFPGGCTICTLAGWGKLVNRLDAPFSKDLMHMRLTIHNCDDCEHEFCGVRDKVFCAQDFSTKSAAESGDSGSPLVCNGVVAGVLTTGEHGIGRVTHFVDVSQYRDFISYFLKGGI